MADNSQRVGFPAFPSSPPAKRLGPIAAGILALAAIAGVTYENAAGTVQDVQQHESGRQVHLAAYLDSVRIPTICDGIIRWPDGRAVKLGDTATAEQCQAMLINE